MRLTGQRCPALCFLVFGQWESSRDVLDTVDAINKQLKALYLAPVKGRYIAFREKVPAMIMQRAGVWTVAVRADLNVRFFPESDCAKHVLQAWFDLAGPDRHFGGYIMANEEFGRINIS